METSNSNANQLKQDKLRQNLQVQISELEMLQSVFYNPGEMRIDDMPTFNDIIDFIDVKTENIPPFLDITINLLVNDAKFEVCINLPHEYPDVEPDIYVRNHKLNRIQHAKLNKDISAYVTQLERGESCIYSAVLWLQENAENYIVPETHNEQQKAEVDDDLARYWIYSHHIYSKSKRRTIADLASTFNITGFCLPGKPGIICVEGRANDCLEWWQIIKTLTWKRIFCKFNEECKEDKNSFIKFNTFEEIVFQNNSIKCNHMDMGELYKFLEEHKCGYVFKELFGIEAKINSS